MRINPINLFTPNLRTVANIATKPTPSGTDTVSFSSNMYSYLKKEGDLQPVRTQTYMFREGVDWERFPNVLENRFKDREKVNVVSHACSDGSEAYTMAIMLLEKLGDEGAQKFLPIQARDFNQNVIDVAKEGFLQLNRGDLDNLEMRGIDVAKYFTPVPEQELKLPYMGSCDGYEQDKTNDNGFQVYKVSDRLRSAVEFKQENVFDYLENLEDNSNTVLFCRNALPYFKYKAQDFIYLANEKLNGKSVLALGLFDKHGLGGDFMRSITNETGFYSDVDGFAFGYSKNGLNKKTRNPDMGCFYAF